MPVLAKFSASVTLCAVEGASAEEPQCHHPLRWMQHQKKCKTEMQEIMYWEAIALVGVGDLTRMQQEPNVAEQALTTLFGGIHQDHVQRNGSKSYFLKRPYCLDPFSRLGILAGLSRRELCAFFSERQWR